MSYFRFFFTDLPEPYTINKKKINKKSFKLRPPPSLLNIDPQIKSVRSEYRDQSIWIMIVQHKSFQLWVC